MSNINEVVEEAIKKRTLKDMKASGIPENHNTSNNNVTENNNDGKTDTPENNNAVIEVTPIVVNTGSEPKTESQNTIKKVKITVYIPEDIFDLFNSIYAHRLLKKRKIDKGSLMAEAIQLLAEYEKERKEDVG